MPDHGGRKGRDTLDAVLQRISDLELKVHQLEGGNRVSFDRGDTATFPVDKNAFEGQTLIQYTDESPWYFSNGEWRPFCVAATVNMATEWLSGASTVIPGNQSGDIAWSRLSGQTLVSLSSATQPAVSARGLYIVDAVALGDSGAATNNEFQFIGNMVQSAFSGSVFAQNVYSASGDPEGSLSIAGVMDSGDTFKLQVFNLDSASRTFSCPSIRVTRVF